MRIGIVGVEQAKLTRDTEAEARRIIRRLIDGADLVVSGECHLGGIDIIAHEEADEAGIPFLPCPPKTLRWSGGYKERNLKIARESDKVICIAVADYPPEYPYERFKSCYHHTPPRTDHCKSGGCWTVKEAARMGKQTEVIVIGK